MKVQRLPIYLIVFSVFLACGFLAGRMISSAAQQSLVTQNPDRQETNIQRPSRLAFPLPNLDALTKDSERTSSKLQSNTDNGQAPIQQNILVIGVDKLQSPRPRLESIWLILYFTDSTHLTLMPIYPAIPVDEIGSTMDNTATEQNFEMGTDHKPSDKLFSTLKDKNIWWNGYLVLDNTAVAELVDFTANARGVLPSYQSGAYAIASLSLIWENPQKALHDQTKLLQELCVATAQLSNIPDVSSLYESITEHVVSDLDLHQLINEWQIRLTQSGRLTCEFPFLNTQ
jgi:hypothetical protein